MALEILPMKLFTRNRPCATCGKATDEVLISEGSDECHYCRTHLIEAFSQGFRASAFKMAVFEYEPCASKYTGQIYAYYPISAFERFNWSAQDQEVMEKVLNEVDTQATCPHCGTDHCRVIYFSKEAAPWRKDARILAEYEGRGEPMCPPCALERLLPSLRDNPRRFVEGLYLPYQTEGMYMTTEL
jgi:hypothetical protein